MMYLVLIFWAITLFDGGRAIWNGEVLHATAVVGASFLAFAAGSGLRGSLHLGNPKIPALIIAIVIFGVSLGLMHYFDLTVDLIDGKIWAAIGASVGFFAARREDALPRSSDGTDDVGEDSAREKLQRYQQAVVRLGAIMEKNPGAALPESALPLPKTEMKSALKAHWLLIDDAYLQGAIEAAYSHLAYFRANLDEKISFDIDVEDATGAHGEPDLGGIKRIQNQVNLFQTINAEAIDLATEFEAYKASQG